MLRLDLPELAIVVWTSDGWQTQANIGTRDSGLGLHVVDIVPAGAGVTFTWRSVPQGHWVGRNF